MYLETGPTTAIDRLLLTHGAGAPMDSPFMNDIAGRLADRGIATTRFEFEYMAMRRTFPKRMPPPKAQSLVQSYATAVRYVRGRMTPEGRLFIGGKSMGGRVASLAADALLADGLISGLVCLGYPFHPPKRPEKLRTAHMIDLKCPALIVQGCRDPFGTQAEVEVMELSNMIRFHWAGDGDHDFAPRSASGFTRQGNLEAAALAVAAFMAA